MSEKGDVRRRAILRFIDAYTRENGWCPSYREISEACNMGSPAEVTRNVGVMRNRGLVRTPDKPVARAIAITDAGREFMMCGGDE
jgi:SOS-response transcriptional repressor LexA